RLTSHEDLLNVWHRLSRYPAVLRRELEKLFTPDTINRLMARFHIMQPLSEESHRKIILEQVKELKRERYSKEQIDIDLRSSYLTYLMSECIIPSEAGRNTAQEAKIRIAAHVEEA